MLLLQISLVKSHPLCFYPGWLLRGVCCRRCSALNFTLSAVDYCFPWTLLSSVFIHAYTRYFCNWYMCTSTYRCISISLTVDVTWVAASYYITAFRLRCLYYFYLIYDSFSLLYVISLCFYIFVDLSVTDFDPYRTVFVYNISCVWSKLHIK